MRTPIPASLLILLLCGCSTQPRPVRIVVYAAASLSDVLPAVAQRYTPPDNATVVWNFAASGTLARQVLAAGRDGIFLSADAHWIDELQNAGRLAENTRTVLLRNRLVLVAHKQGRTIANLEDLCTHERFPFPKIAIGDPDYVPAGRYAVHWLTNIRCDKVSLWQRWTNSQRIHPAADVRAALAFARSRRDGAAIVYRTDYLSAPEDLALLYTVPPAVVDVAYEAALLKDSGPAARAFLAFLQTPIARRAFAAAGFDT